jgi:hypothetical protein
MAKEINLAEKIAIDSGLQAGYNSCSYNNSNTGS